MYYYMSSWRPTLKNWITTQRITTTPLMSGYCFDAVATILCFNTTLPRCIYLIARKAIDTNISKHQLFIYNNKYLSHQLMLYNIHLCDKESYFRC